jgi:hypothetical protein
MLIWLLNSELNPESQWATTVVQMATTMVPVRLYIFYPWWPTESRFSGPPDDVLSLALHEYSRTSLSLNARLDYLLKDYNYKIGYA